MVCEADKQELVRGYQDAEGAVIAGRHEQRSGPGGKEAEGQTRGGEELVEGEGRVCGAGEEAQATRPGNPFVGQRGKVARLSQRVASVVRALQGPAVQGDLQGPAPYTDVVESQRGETLGEWRYDAVNKGRHC